MAAERATSPTTMCHECGAQVPENTGFVSWCECGWNLTPPNRAAPKSALECLYLAMGRKHGEALFQRVKASGTVARGLSVPGLLLGVLSFGVLLAMPLLLILAPWVIAATWFNLFALLAGLFLFFAAWVLWPRPYRLPRNEILDPASHPHLMRFIGDVADRVGAPRPDVVAANALDNACVAREGWRGRRALVLGLPLLAALEDEEWVALFGHELGHLTHGDERWGTLSGAGMQAVAGWCEVLTPDSVHDGGEDIESTISAIVLEGISYLPRSLLSLMVHLAWADSQRAEYRADRVAASVAGTTATVGLLSKFLGTYGADQAAQLVVQGRTERGILAEVAHRARTLPARERERLRCMANMETPTLDATHPPEGLRIRMLEETVPVAGARLLDRADRASIESELRPAVERVEAELAEAYRNRLHGL